MPMSFPDMKSLINVAEVHKFRKQWDAETETDYRIALATHVKPIDRIESYEILFGIGWDQWSMSQKLESMNI